MGKEVGVIESIDVGDRVGMSDGAGVDGDFVGDIVGASVVGAFEGDRVGCLVVGDFDGRLDGDSVGDFVGDIVRVSRICFAWTQPDLMHEYPMGPMTVTVTPAHSEHKDEQPACALFEFFRI